MTSSLANVFATFSRKYGESYTINYVAPTTYLQNIVGLSKNPTRIILICQEDCSKIYGYEEFPSPSKLRVNKNATANADMDLTGSPLKDVCDVDVINDMSLDIKLVIENPWTLQEECHKGISVEKARALICSDDFQASDEGINAQGSIWLLCNGADTEKTIFLQYEFGTGFFNRGIITFLGIVPTNSLNCQSLLRRHFMLINGNNRVEAHIENTYYVKSHVSLSCRWSTNAPQPSLIDLSSCDVTLSQTFHANKCGPLTQDFMNQLQILTNIRDDIVSYKETDINDIDKEPLYRWGRGIEMHELHENINKVMTEISGFGEIDINGLIESDIEAVIQRANLRQLTDLTDKLWEILKRCPSYKDLKQAFNILFQCAARCNIVNTPTNKNRLAEIITEIANRRLAMPCLSGSEPLELLLEIGLEKIYKDYEFIFSESKICSATRLRKKRTSISNEKTNETNDNVMQNVRKSLRNAVRPEVAATRKTLLHSNIKGGSYDFKNVDVGFKNSNFDEAETGAILANLIQIHCTLEHLLMLHINLNLSHVHSDVCEQLLQRVPQFVDSMNASLIDKIEVSLSANDVREFLESKDPHTRRITFKSKNTFRKVKSTYFFSVENICPPSVSENFHTDDKEIVKENSYHVWLYRKMKSLK